MTFSELVCFGFIVYTFWHQSVFTNVFLLDGIVSGLHFLLYFYIKKVPLKQIPSLVPIVDKYILIGMYCFGLFVLHVFFWLPFHFSNCTLFLILPSSVNLLIDYEVHILVKTKLKAFGNWFICSCFSWIVNKVAKVSLDVNPNLDYREFLQVVETENLKENFASFIHQLVTFAVCHHLGITYVYKLPFYSSNEDNKKYIYNIVHNRQWNKLNELRTLHALFDLIVNDIDKHKKLISGVSNKFVVAFFNFMLVWSLSAVHIGLGVLVYATFMFEHKSWTISLLQGLLTLTFFHNIVLGSVLLVYSPYVLFVLYSYGCFSKLYNVFTFTEYFYILPVVFLLWGFQYTAFISVLMCERKSVEMYTCLALCFCGVFSSFSLLHLLTVYSLIHLYLAVKNAKEVEPLPTVQFIQDYF
jgi:hypothetical protein